MSMKRLRTEMMVAISTGWLDPKLFRLLIEGFALGKARLPFIEQAHRGLTALVESETAVDRELTALQGDSQAADVTFGRSARGVFFTLTGLAEAAETPEIAARYTTARDVILPQGTAVVRLKYAEKGGAVEMIASRRTPEIDLVLASVTLLDGTTLADTLDRLIAAGRTLAANENRKRDIEQRRAALAETAPQTQTARLFWMRVARALTEDVAMAGLDAEVSNRILGGLHEAIARAGSAARGEEPTDDETGAETDVTPPVKDAAPVVVNPEAPANDTAPAARKVG